jgi:hypothetical protein
LTPRICSSQRDRHLEQLDAAVGARQDEVGERTADVDADPEAHRR